MHAALALSLGYPHGRRRTRRIAAVLTAAAAGYPGGLGSATVRRGLKMPGPAQAPGQAAARLGKLPGAGTAAATTMATNRIESLTGPPQERAGLVRDPGVAVTRPGQAVQAGASETARNARRRGRTVAGGDSARSREPARPSPKTVACRAGPEPVSARRRISRAAD
jgi:hypothetical protein